jgi:hypothetical protein
MSGGTARIGHLVQHWGTEYTRIILANDTA